MKNFMRIFCAIALCVLVLANIGGVTANAAEVPCEHNGTLHYYDKVDPTCGAPGVTAAIECQLCGEYVVAPSIRPATGDHTYRIDHTDPSCVVGGSDVQVCTVCGAIGESVAIAPTGHTYGEWTVVEAATTTKEGQDVRVCAGCGAKEYRTTEKLPSGGAVDASPKTGDMTGMISATVVTVVAMMAVVAFVFKRKAA